MIFEKILDGLTTAIEFIAKLILFLLRALGLWIPALYSLAFLVVCLIFQVAFDDVAVAYFIGLAISVLLALYIICIKVIKNKKRRFMKNAQKREELQQKKEEKRKKKEEKKSEVEDMKQEGYIAPNDGGYERKIAENPEHASAYDGYVAPNDGGYARRRADNPTNSADLDRYVNPADSARFGAYDERGEERVHDDYVHPNSLTDSDVEPIGYRAERPSMPQPQSRDGYDDYVAPNTSKQSEKVDFGGYIRPDDSSSFAYEPEAESVRRDYESSVRRDMREKEEPFVQPRIFRTRMDENMLIYEYPHRLVFYKRQPNGTWKCVGAEMKPKRG